ncbi:MAG: phosphonate C-P lyase system protein PhnG [Pseudonocardiaceae bacterium]
MSPPLTPEERAGLLVHACTDELIALADRITAGGGCRVTTQPQVGTVLLQVREPVVGERFYLTEVLVTEAEVAVLGAEGWAMRLGDDRLATLAAAVCDGAAEAGHHLAEDVERLCAQTAREQADARAEEQSLIAPTTVRFEELDR